MDLNVILCFRGLGCCDHISTDVYSAISCGFGIPVNVFVCIVIVMSLETTHIVCVVLACVCVNV